MASSPITPPPVNRVPNSAAPDAQNNQTLNSTKQAAFIDIWISGPSASNPNEYVPGVTQFSVRETYQGAGYRAQSGTFRQERTLGSLVFQGSYTRMQQRLRPLKALIARVYGFPSASQTGFRLDMCPVTITVQYALVGPNFNYSNPLDVETNTYPEVYFTDKSDDHVQDPNGLSMESGTFEGQNEQYSGGGIVLVTPNYSQSYPAMP